MKPYPRLVQILTLVVCMVSPLSLNTACNSNTLPAISNALNKITPYLVEAQQLLALANQMGEQWIQTTNPDPEIAAEFRDKSQLAASALNTSTRLLNDLKEFDQAKYEEAMKPAKQAYDDLAAFLKEHRVFGSSRLGADVAPGGEFKRPQAFDLKVE